MGKSKEANKPKVDLIFSFSTADKRAGTDISLVVSVCPSSPLLILTQQ